MFVCFNAPKSEALSVLIWCTAELQLLIHFLLIPVCPPVKRLKQQVGFTHREAQATGDLTASLFCRSDRRIWHQSINELMIYTKKLHWFLKLGLWRRRAAEERVGAKASDTEAMRRDPIQLEGAPSEVMTGKAFEAVETFFTDTV